MARKKRSSRLTRYAEKQSKKQFLIFGIGTIIVIAVLIQFAGFFLNLFGNLVFGIRGDEENITVEDISEEFLAAPDLINIPDATSSAEITIHGNSPYEDGRVILYVNNSEVNKTNLGSNGNFTFRKVNLKSGSNILNVKYQTDDRESNLSDDHEIILTSEKPGLEITHPSDGSTFKKADRRITISGKTEENNSVTINGFRAVVKKNGEFSYLLELDEGENILKIESVNQAGIKNTKEIKVTYED